MIKCQLGLLAKGIIRDVDSNAISVYHIIEQFQVKTFPVFVPEVIYFAALIRDPEDPLELESIVKIRLDDTIVVESPMKSDFQGKRSNRLILRIGGLPIPGSGNLTAELVRQDNGEILNRYEVKVTLIDTKPTVETQTGPVGA